MGTIATDVDQDLGREPIGQFTFHAGQAEAFLSPARIKTIVAGRRWGKTEFGVMDCLHFAKNLSDIGVRGGLIWYIVPTYRLARPVWDKFMALAPAGWITDTKGTRSAPDSLMVGSTRVEFKSAENPGALVGVGLRKVYIDEAGIIKEQVWAESIQPALVDFTAPAMIFGTPKGKNWFYYLVQRGLDPEYPDYATFGGPSFENPYVPVEALQNLRLDMYRDLYRQEVLAIFLEGEGEVFRNLAKIVGRAVKAFGGLGYCNHPTRFVGVDLAKLVDFSVLYGVCAYGHPTGFDRFNHIAWTIQKHRIISAYREARTRSAQVHVVVDASGVGDVVVDDLVDEVELVPVKTGPRKRELIEGYAMMLDEGGILLPNERVIIGEHEAYTYEIGKTGHVRYSAPEGLHDDCVTAAALAGWGLRNAPAPLMVTGG